MPLVSRMLAAIALGALAAPAAHAQLIGVRTVPIAAGDQFAFVPARSAAMGGVGVALPDELGDPFNNPATAGRGPSRFFASPTVFAVARRNGAVRSLPLGAVFSSPNWFGGGAATLQQVVAADQWNWGGIPLTQRPSIPEPAFGRDRSAANLYATGLLGRRFGSLSVGLAATYADLTAMHGVELLYAGSLGIQQFGDVLDLRAGLAADLPGTRTLELVAVHRRLNMTHDVTYLDAVFDSTNGWQQVARVTSNRDQARTSGLHANLRVPVAGAWTLGIVGTGNYTDHLAIPNYDLAGIPRDPGTTWAWNAGVGLAHRRGGATFAVEAILEPVRSHTWADAAADTVAADGRVIRAGEVTVDNRFRFTNALLRMGLAEDIEAVTVHAGLQVRSIRYRLDQADRVEQTARRQIEDWMEWTPTWGVSVRLPEFELRYTGRVTTGTGRPGVAWTPGATAREATLEAANFIVAPSGPLTLQDANVVTHQFAVVVPIR